MHAWWILLYRRAVCSAAWAYQCVVCQYYQPCQPMDPYTCCTSGLTICFTLFRIEHSTKGRPLSSRFIYFVCLQICQAWAMAGAYSSAIAGHYRALIETANRCQWKELCIVLAIANSSGFKRLCNGRAECNWSTRWVVSCNLHQYFTSRLDLLYISYVVCCKLIVRQKTSSVYWVTLHHVECTISPCFPSR